MSSTQVITHRGLEPNNPNFFSESSFEAFQNHLSRGFGGIEFDINTTKDGFVILHDTTLKRSTNGKDHRLIANLTTAEVVRVPLANGRIPTFDEVMDLIKNSSSQFNALHLKSHFQTEKTLQKVMEALSKYDDIFDKFFIFDVKKNTARILKKHFPTIRLAPSVAHPYDIQRFNKYVGETLLSLEEALELKKDGLIDGIWGDEWDTDAGNGSSKLLYTSKFFERIHHASMFSVVVTPELHGTSPGLYGGELHPDSKNIKTLLERIKKIKAAGNEYFCTDYPEEVAKL